MAGYAASNLNATTPAQQALTTTFKTLINLSSSATVRRIKVHEFVFGTDGTPADNAMTWDVSSTSAIGTGTSGVITKLDPADAAALSVSTINHTVEPTVTANSSLWSAGMNQRATHRWVAYPGQELVVPATSAAGLAFRAKSPGYTGTAVAQVEFVEQ
jgi:pyridoxal biosynthesis lyase PdxS